MAECLKCGRTIETGQKLCSAHSSPHVELSQILKTPYRGGELYRAEQTEGTAEVPQYPSQTEGTAEVPASKNAKTTKIGRVS